MKNKEKIKVFLVDDDAVYLKLLEIELHHYPDYLVETFTSGENCVQHLSHQPDVIVLDYYLNGTDKNAMNGIQTLDKILAFNREISVVMLSEQDKIEHAVKCMSHNALDYVVKGDTAFTRLAHILGTIYICKNLDV